MSISSVSHRPTQRLPQLDNPVVPSKVQRPQGSGDTSKVQRSALDTKPLPGSGDGFDERSSTRQSLITSPRGAQGATGPEALGFKSFMQVPDLGNSDGTKPGGAVSQRTAEKSVDAREALNGAVDAQGKVTGTPYSPDQMYKQLDETKDGLGAQKQAVWQAAMDAKATPEEAAILVAQLMQEGGRDPLKDGWGSSANYGPFNLNGDMLTNKCGVAPEDLAKLNEISPESLKMNVEAALHGMHEMGVDNYLHHVRGGRKGYDDPTHRVTDEEGVQPDDNFRFERNVVTNAAKVLAEFQTDPSSMKSDRRYAGDIPHLYGSK